MINPNIGETMTENIDPNKVAKFLSRVMEIERSPSYTKKGQDSSRKDKINAVLEEFCK